MSTSRDRVRQALSHQGSDRIPVDFGATAVTGIHCRVVEALRKHYGLSYKPVKNAAMVESLDENIGRLLDTLHRSGLDERTIVVFTSDHGGMATSNLLLIFAGIAL
nr:sulfatase-like hydrolase/transferase [Bacteroides fragilis]